MFRISISPIIHEYNFFEGMAMKYEGGNSYRIMIFCLPKQFFQYSMCVSIFLEEQDVIINSSVTQIHLLRLDLSMNDCNYFKESKCK